MAMVAARRLARKNNSINRRRGRDIMAILLRWWRWRREQTTWRGDMKARSGLAHCTCTCFCLHGAACAVFAAGKHEAGRVLGMREK